MEEDPLQIQQLTLAYDYLMFKINDRVATLGAGVLEQVQQKNEQVGSAIESLDNNIESLKSVLRQLDDLETDFVKLEHIKDIVAEFKTRVRDVEAKTKRIDEAS